MLFTHFYFMSGKINRNLACSPVLLQAGNSMAF